MSWPLFKEEFSMQRQIIILERILTRFPPHAMLIYRVKCGAMTIPFVINYPWHLHYVAAPYTVYPKKYAHGFVVLCFVVVMQSFIMNSHEVFIHIHQGCFAGTGAIVRLPQCQWSKPDGYGKISQCITTTKHSKAKTVCIFLGIYYMSQLHIYDLWIYDTLCIVYGVQSPPFHHWPS